MDTAGVVRIRALAFHASLGDLTRNQQARRFPVGFGIIGSSGPVAWPRQSASTNETS
jgi:hypothetical protein